jgi:hypothetical protein
MSWLSGPCVDDDEPGTFIVLEGRPSDAPERERIEQLGNVIWIDTGSGPGWSPVVLEAGK